MPNGHIQIEIQISVSIRRSAQGAVQGIPSEIGSVYLTAKKNPGFDPGFLSDQF
jgi:hypothetical protein